MKELFAQPNKKQSRFIVAFGLLFVVLNTVFIAKEFYWFSLVPIVLLFVSLLLLSLEKLLLVTAFLVPLSINLEVLDFGMAISIPSEPLMISIMLVFILSELYEQRLDLRILKHPMSVLVILHLSWFFITSLTSEMPIVSLKAFASRLWFIVPFYFLCTHMFYDLKKINLFLWLNISALTLVILYSTYGLWTVGFNEEMSQSAMTPFFPSHTSYGAVICLFIPFLFVSAQNKRQSKGVRLISVLLFLVFSTGIILSYSRAVWVSIPAALVIYISLLLKIRFNTILIICLGFLALIFVFQHDIALSLKKNKQDSSEKFTENIQSISNISTDDSNTERLNRWYAALAMFKERPVLGWGPGTYQFQYAPFQKSKDLTLISTNAGTLGNAHSEYLGPLAERGLFGGLIFLVLIIYSVYLAFHIYSKAKSQEVKLTVLAAIMGLGTYYVHGFLNNYLDTEKAAVPFWAFLAIITALDLALKKDELA